jgi:hypothetical protein
MEQATDGEEVCCCLSIATGETFIVFLQNGRRVFKEEEAHHLLKPDNSRYQRPTTDKGFMHRGLKLSNIGLRVYEC